MAKHGKAGETADAAHIIAELQAELAFQGEGLRHVNDALARQQQDLLLLRRQLTLLSEQLRAQREGSDSKTDQDVHEKPPHY